MEVPLSLRPDWAAPAPRARFNINNAFVVSVLLHLAGLGVAMMWWPELVTRRVPAESRLSVSFIDAPVDMSVPESPAQSQPAIAENAPAQVDKPVLAEAKPAPAAVEPVPAVPDLDQPARKPLSAMIEEAVKETPVVEPEASRRGGGTVFDPRLRSKLSAAQDKVKREEEKGLKSYAKPGGATHVDLGNGRCFEVRREVGMDNREVWWTVACSPDSSTVQWPERGH